MLDISFQTAVQAVLQIFLMGAIGFVLVRRGVVAESGLKLLSFLSINICFPLFIFNQILHNFNPSEQKTWWTFPLINIGLGLFGLGLAGIISSLIKTKNRRQWMAASGFHNAGYIPLLLATTLPLGDLTPIVYASVILSIVGFDLCLWSLGVWLITRQRGGITIKNFLNPPLIAMFAAFALVLVGGKNIVPSIMIQPMKIMGDSALALAMLTIGGNLGLTRFSRAGIGEILGAVSLKVLVMPVCGLVFLSLIQAPPIFAFVFMIQSCMPTSITLSVIARYNNSDGQDFINQTIFYSHVISIITIPLFLGLYGMLIVK